MYKVSVKKTAVSLRIDTDVVMALKEMGTGYQTRINNILRKAVFGIKLCLDSHLFYK
ncbi:BrnA antitoxin family protein [Treponema socranskii]|uniref:BrnA antitoxin family protein n=1 Tax=Treponema socranskii TaxID=53419 RepID=UPI003D8F32FE